MLRLTLSCSAKAGHLVRRSSSIESLTSRSTGSPAFAGDDTVSTAYTTAFSSTRLARNARA
nr:hypothetical protein CIT39_03705 [Bradyrhizobium symbiodeficiens]